MYAHVHMYICYIDSHMHDRQRWRNKCITDHSKQSVNHPANSLTVKITKL